MTDPRFWSDQPITGSAQDGFGRAGYAKRAADLIVNSRSKDVSTVFGITGPWGSGKTSLIEMVLESLNEAHRGWHVARFTPWSSADVSGLLSEFYTSLVAALPKDHQRAVKKSLAVLLQIAAPAVKLVPLAGDAASSAAEMAGQALTRKTPWDTAFEKATARLREADISLLIIADDVDRLQADELVMLLKVVRLLGRFPGVQYLLAYDDQTLTQTLSTTWGVDDGGKMAEKFMEKIVQYPLVIPPLLDHQLVNRFDSGVDLALREAGRPPMQSRRLGNIISILPALLPTPRAVDRLLAQLRHYLILLDPSEINDEDIVLLALVRTSFPRLYSALPQWKTRLIRGRSEEIDHSASQFRFAPADWDQLFGLVPDAAVDNAKRLLAELFPEMPREKYALKNTEGDRRICDENYFDRYFAMSILSGDVSDAQVLRALGEAKQGRADVLTDLLVEEKGSRTALVISKAVLADSDTSDERLAVLSGLAKVVDRLDEDRSAFASNREQALSWMAGIISQLDPGALATSIAKALSSASTVSRLKVWMKVFKTFQGTTRPPEWMAGVSQEMIDTAVGAFVEHLRARDDARLDEPVIYYAFHAVKLGGAARLREEVLGAMRDTDVTLEDLAARLVSSEWSVATDAASELTNVDQSLWVDMAPDTDDSWYQLPVEKSIDLKDLSWANRRRYARGRVKRPTEHG